MYRGGIGCERVGIKLRPNGQLETTVSFSRFVLPVVLVSFRVTGHNRRRRDWGIREKIVDVGLVDLAYSPSGCAQRFRARFLVHDQRCC